MVISHLSEAGSLLITKCISHRICTYNEIKRDLNIPMHLWSKCIPISPTLRLSFNQIILNHSLKQIPWWEATSSPESRNSPQFIKSNDSLPCSQQLATCPYPGRHKFSTSHTKLSGSHPLQYYPPIHASCWHSLNNSVSMLLIIRLSCPNSQYRCSLWYKFQEEKYRIK